jgi:hypothetical protein
MVYALIHMHRTISFFVFEKQSSDLSLNLIICNYY